MEITAMNKDTLATILDSAPGGELRETMDDQVEEFICADPKTKELIELAERVAKTEASVMISGESGTGKEMFARHIHSKSARSNGPFVAVNCAAIPHGMLESTLFGHEKGAFTGAYQTHIGKFEQSQKGTLLLDEITEIDLDVQAKLLRVLQEKEIERLGGRKTIPLNVRVLATTNRELTREVAHKRFRRDLYYRLNVFPLTLPPLAQRPGDILPLASSRLRLFAPPGAKPPSLTCTARRKLLAHTWPGNVRELDNVIQRAIILADSGQIQARDICTETESVPAPPAADMDAHGLPESERLSDDLKLRERDLILQALQAERGNRQAAARRLGISPRTLRYKIARLREQGLGMPVVLSWESA
jgi:two-component system response regulator FlrC